MVEALCDDKVVATLTNKLQENLTQFLNTKIEQLIKDSILEATSKLVTEQIKDSKLELTSLICRQDDRINDLENKLYQHEFLIYGMDTNIEEDNDASNQDPNKGNYNPLIRQVIKLINDCLNIQVGLNEVNFVYKLNKSNKGNMNNPLPVVLNLVYD